MLGASHNTSVGSGPWKINRLEKNKCMKCQHVYIFQAQTVGKFWDMQRMHKTRFLERQLNPVAKRHVHKMAFHTAFFSPCRGHVLSLISYLQRQFPPPPNHTKQVVILTALCILTPTLTTTPTPKKAQEETSEAKGYSDKRSEWI